MPEKLSNEQKHERIYCAFTHRRIAWSFVALCAVEVFVSWRGLDKPIARPSLFELSFYILLVAVYAPMSIMVLRCFSERFVVGVCTAVFVKAVAYFFAPILFNPVTGLVGRAFLVLWVLAFLVSLNMLVQALRNPRIECEKRDMEQAKR